jgi:hypothetical protein
MGVDKESLLRDANVLVSPGLTCILLFVDEVPNFTDAMVRSSCAAACAAVWFQIGRINLVSLLQVPR